MWIKKLSRFFKDRPELSCAVSVGVWTYSVFRMLRIPEPNKWLLALSCLLLGLTLSELFGIFYTRRKVNQTVFETLEKYGTRLHEEVLIELCRHAPQRTTIREMVDRNLRQMGIDPDAVREAVRQLKDDREEELRYDRDLARDRKEKMGRLKPGAGNAVALDSWGWKDPDKDD